MCMCAAYRRGRSLCNALTTRARKGSVVRAVPQKINHTTYSLMKNIAAIAIWIALALGVIGGCWYLYDAVAQIAAPQTSQNVGGAGFSIDQAYYLASAGTGAGFATTTPGEASASTTISYFLPSSATTTITGFSGRATTIDLNLLEVASSTSSVWIYTVQFSPNYVSATGNGDWYNEDCSTITSNTVITHGAGACTHTWTPNTTATVKKNIGIGTAQSKWFRINIQVTGAGGSLYAQAIPREVVPN